MPPLAASHFCVFVDACEAGGSALEFSQVAAAREWNDADHGHSFAAFFASHPFVNAKDGVYLSLLASVLERGPSNETITRARQAWGNFGLFCRLATLRSLVDGTAPKRHLTIAKIEL